LSEVHVDALKEIVNIGMGHAATALNQMIGKPISLTIPEVNLCPLAEAREMIGGDEELVVCVFIRIWGDVQGAILIIFPRESASSLCRMLTGEGPGEDFSLSELQVSALREIGNILCSSYLAAIERLLGISLLPSVPSVAFDLADAIVESVLSQLGQKAELTLTIKAAFTGADRSVHGHFFLLPDPGSLKLVLRAARVLAEDGK